MKASDIKDFYNAQSYIGTSKTWKKAWLASMAKWENTEYGKDTVCGFCMVTANKKSIPLWKITKECDACEICPASEPCFSSVGYIDRPEAIQWLNDNKQHIYALDKE